MTTETEGRKRLHVLLLITNMGFGGAQRAFHFMSRELGRQFSVSECVISKTVEVAYPTSNQLFDLAVPGGGGLLLKAFHLVQRCLRARSLKRRLGIDVAISHLEGADYVNLLSRYREKVILCIQGSKIHDGEIRGVMGWIRKSILMPLLYRRADHIVCVSRALKLEMTDGLGLPPDRISVIANPCDVESVRKLAGSAIPEEFDLLFRDSAILTTAGRLAPQKNQAALLDSFKLTADRVALKLVVLGDGPLRDELVDRAESLGLRPYCAWRGEPPLVASKVFFMGYQENPFRYIARSSAFVLPSSWEGFPLALLEAMACGVPVLASDCPTGPREILAPELFEDLSTVFVGEYGVLAPVPQSAATLRLWSDAIVNLIGNESLRTALAQRALARVKEYRTEKVFAAWNQLILDLAS